MRYDDHYNVFYSFKRSIILKRQDIVNNDCLLYTSQDVPLNKEPVHLVLFVSQASVGDIPTDVQMCIRDRLNARASRATSRPMLP